MRPFLSLLFLGLLVAPVSQAQSSLGTDPVCADLIADVERLGPTSIQSRGPESWVVFEDRVSRQPLRSALEWVEENRAAMSQCRLAGIAPQRFGLRAPALRADGQPLSMREQASFGRAASGVQIDLEVELLYNFAIDYPVDWFRDRIAIGPKVRVWWPSGLVLAAQYAFPIRNQLPEQHADYWEKPYPNVLMAGFRRQIAPNWIGAISGGFFERNRYGGDLQLYWISERWPVVIGGRAGMSGYWAFDDGELITGPVNFFNGYLDGTVYLPWHNLRLRGRTGQFIREINQFRRPGEDVKRNPGTSGELTRIFGEIEFGLHLFYDGHYVFPGFRFAAPLSPRKGLKRGRIAAYPTRQHYVPYDLGRAIRGEITGFIRPNRGEIHDTGVDIWNDLRMLAPHMLPVLE